MTLSLIDPFAALAAPSVLAAGLSAERVDTWARELGSAPVSGDDAALVDELTALERLKSAIAARQARVTIELARSQATARPHQDPADAEASLGAQVGLARRMSPVRGRAALRLARMLCTDLPFTLDALAAGQISEWQATLISREVTALDAPERAQVDFELAGRLGSMGDKRIADQARAIADRLDPDAALRRLAGAENERRVSIRPIRDGMVQLSALLPMVTGISAYAALHAHAKTAKTAGDERGIGQIMADELCTRLTTTPGDTSKAPGPDVAVNLIITDHALLSGSDEPVTAMGPDGTWYGTIPAPLARRLVRQADQAWIRRLYTTPQSSELVAMDKTTRCFTGRLRDLIVYRDQTCRTPWCEAPIRHIDHTQPHATGGQTSLANAQGLCEACNYTKEHPGWHTKAIDHPGGGTTIETTTPTGHQHRSKAPPGHRTCFTSDRSSGADVSPIRRRAATGD